MSRSVLAVQFTIEPHIFRQQWTSWRSTHTYIVLRTIQQTEQCLCIIVVIQFDIGSQLFVWSDLFSSAAGGNLRNVQFNLSSCVITVHSSWDYKRDTERKWRLIKSNVCHPRCFLNWAREIHIVATCESEINFCLMNNVYFKAYIFAATNRNQEGKVLDCKSVFRLLCCHTIIVIPYLQFYRHSS